MVARVTTLLEDARTELVAALRSGLAPWPAYRVHPIRPPKPAPPMVWVEAFNLRPDTIAGAPATVAEASVVAIVDGDYGRQVAALDVITAALWQAVDDIAVVTGALVAPIDVGGPRLLGVTVTADLTLTVRTLCPDTLTGQKETTP